ncbi:MAG: transposase [Sphingobacteriales bacterium]|nr:MAG: transposase [Sphingobacteriales bacterium]
MLNERHPLYFLSSVIDWVVFKREFTPLYSKDTGRPAKPIRLIVGIFILKYTRNLSDESIVEQWAENLYYQYFCVMKDFVHSPP